MSRIGLLPAAGRLVQPWKNGGGTTIGIAAAPPAAGSDAFDWRISTARVAAPGRFSNFADVDRTLAVIEGRLALAFGGTAGSIELDVASRPHAFPGDIACFGTPLGGEVVDLNLMVRRGRWTGTIERIALSGGRSFALPSPGAVILSISGGHVGWRAETLPLRPWDAVRIDDAAGEVIELRGDSAIYVVALTPLSA